MSPVLQTYDVSLLSMERVLERFRRRLCLRGTRAVKVGAETAPKHAPWKAGLTRRKSAFCSRVSCSEGDIDQRNTACCLVIIESMALHESNLAVPIE